jgi:hypothetical protein
MPKELIYVKLSVTVQAIRKEGKMKKIILAVIAAGTLSGSALASGFGDLTLAAKTGDSGIAIPAVSAPTSVSKYTPFMGVRSCDVLDFPSAAQVPGPIAVRRLEPCFKDISAEYDTTVSAVWNGYTIQIVTGYKVYAKLSEALDERDRRLFGYEVRLHMLGSMPINPAPEKLTVKAPGLLAQIPGRMTCVLEPKALGEQYTISFDPKELAGAGYTYDAPVKVSPSNSYLETLNENIIVGGDEKGNLVISGDADGFYLVSLTLSGRDGFRKGMFKLKDSGEGCGNMRGAVTCEIASR